MELCIYSSIQGDLHCKGLRVNEDKTKLTTQKWGSKKVTSTPTLENDNMEWVDMYVYLNTLVRK